MASKRRKSIKTANAELEESADTQRRFLRRWSERKAQVRAREKLPASKPAMRELAPPTKVDEPTPLLTDADMPPVDALDENSDYKGFLSPQVSDKLRRLALRKLFHLPKFNIRDGLDDYDEDFRTFEALGNIVTAHERNQLELKRQEDQERLARAKDEAEEAAHTENDSEAEGPHRREQVSDETASIEPENNEDLEEDSERSRHG
jgi:hypothetical protein